MFPSNRLGSGIKIPVNAIASTLPFGNQILESKSIKMPSNIALYNVSHLSVSSFLPLVEILGTSSKIE